MTNLRRAILLGCVGLLAASVARAQVQPPPETLPPPATSPPPAPPAGAPPAAAPAPIAPLSPTMAPEPAPAPPLMLAERTQPLQPLPQPEPFYRKWWFWGALSVVVATVTIIVIWNVGSNDNPAPATTFGNMHAF